MAKNRKDKCRLYSSPCLLGSPPAITQSGQTFRSSPPVESVSFHGLPLLEIPCHGALDHLVENLTTNLYCNYGVNLPALNTLAPCVVGLIDSVSSSQSAPIPSELGQSVCSHAGPSSLSVKHKQKMTAFSANKISHYSRSSKLDDELSFQIKLHAVLLWASFGLLMPVGILIIRISQRVECLKKLRILFYAHVTLQIVSAMLSTVAAFLSLKNLENSFNNTHQRFGLAIYLLLWVQPIFSFFRPQRESKVRSIWYVMHWMLGTGVCVAGVVNIYIGLYSYQAKSSTSIKLWAILFTVEVIAMAFLYLLQDRWHYIKRQGVSLGDEQVAPADHSSPPAVNNENKLGVLFRTVEF